MKFNASETKSVSNSSDWIAIEVTTSAVIGAPWAFSRPRKLGKSSLRAGMYMTSAAIRVQAR